ncbi:MAG TPA: bifunctional metallophosphatase/5'-nucleotidase, partial [Rhizobiales bacterium]|nr:bifunctional metallophosphatase/5'-nucleotidase [Hyphomicrobiales bacterium]
RLLLVLLVVASGGFAAQGSETVSKKVTLVFMCDVYNMSPDRNGRGGMAKLAAVVKAERASGHPVIVVHAGDTISPSLMSGLDQGAHMIDLLNMVRPDVFVPGNHEFDFGPQVFKKRMGEAKFPVFAANLGDENGKPLPGILSSTIIDAGGVRVGIIGLTAEDSVQRSSPGNLTFSPSPRLLYRLAGQLRKKGADIIVGAVHAHRDVDRKLMAEKAADIILSGDDHDLQIRYDGKRAFVEAMEDGYYVVAIDLDITIKQKGNRRRVKWWPDFRLIDTKNVKGDETVAARVAVYEAELSREMDVALGTTKTEFDSKNATVRGGEAAIGNLFADAVRAATGADVALLNGGGFRAKKVYPAGSKISRRDVLAELPFSNKTYVLEITGRDLLAALEQGFSGADSLTGAFPQVSGMTIRADVSRPAGKRVVKVMIGASPLDENRTYRLATNDFLAAGGDGYSALKRAKIVVGEADGKLIANHVMAYIRKNSPVTAKIEGRTIVGRGQAVE